MSAAICNVVGRVAIGNGAYFAEWSGMCYSGGGVVHEDPNTGGSGAKYTNFDLSRGSSLYTNNTDTLNPNSTKTIFLIKY